MLAANSIHRFAAFNAIVEKSVLREYVAMSCVLAANTVHQPTALDAVVEEEIVVRSIFL